MDNKNLETGAVVAVAEEPEVKKEPQEIERKFLVRQLPEGLKSEDGEAINQGYLAIDSNGTEVRLRQRGDKYYQTVKTAGKAVRNEWELEITEEHFNTFWAATAGRRIEKTRFVIPYEDVKIELDVFGDKLAGLYMAEVEFESEEEADKFEAPDWFNEEVTADKRFKNKYLATVQAEEAKELIA